MLDFLNEHHISHEHQISIDGKVLKATAKRGNKKSGICIVSAWACEQNLVLGGIKAQEKSNEKKAIPLLLEQLNLSLEQLNLSEAVVSIDAIANSPTIAEQIIDKGGEYILSLKKNQKYALSDHRLEPGSDEQAVDYMQARKEGLKWGEKGRFWFRTHRNPYLLCLAGVGLIRRTAPLERGSVLDYDPWQAGVGR